MADLGGEDRYDLTDMDYVRAALAQAAEHKMDAKDLLAIAEHSLSAEGFDSAVNLFTRMLPDV